MLVIRFNVLKYSQTPCSSFTNPSLRNPDNMMFNACHVDKEWNIFSFKFYFYIYSVQYYPIQFNVTNKLGQK